MMACAAFALPWASGAASPGPALVDALAWPASPVATVLELVDAGLQGHGTRSSATSCARSTTTPCSSSSASFSGGAA